MIAELWRRASAFIGCRDPLLPMPGLGALIGAALGDAMGKAWVELQMANPMRPLTAADVVAALFGKPTPPDVIVPERDLLPAALAEFRAWRASGGGPETAPAELVVLVRDRQAIPQASARTGIDQAELRRRARANMH